MYTSVPVRRQPRAIQQLCLAGPQFLGGVKCQQRAGVAQCFGAGRLVELGEIYDSACAGESVGNNCLTLLAQFEGNDEGWSAQLHSAPRLARVGSKAINTCSPLTGAWTGLPLGRSQITGGPFLPCAAGPWKWAMVAGPDSPL